MVEERLRIPKAELANFCARLDRFTSGAPLNDMRGVIDLPRRRVILPYPSFTSLIDLRLLDPMATSYSDSTYQLFSDHVNADEVKRHQKEQARVQRMVSHFGTLIQYDSETDHIRTNLGNL